MAIAILLCASFFTGAFATTFTFQNNCPFTVWPATLSGAGSLPLPQTGFELAARGRLPLAAPPKWSGRMWARTKCATDSSNRFTCAIGDCGTGQVACNGAGGSPPASLVEFTLNGADGKDFYDVSLVDGFNVPVSVGPVGGHGCTVADCPADINAACPDELKYSVDGAVLGCKSACIVFQKDEYCCKGQYNDPNKCKPSSYSQLFKNACPRAYSYPYDDASSTFTCTGVDYLITFCP